MTTLLGPNGQPIQEFKKAPPPKLGPAFGNWAGRDALLNQMPGGAILQFNLDMLTLADFRAMRYHPQINASLTILKFMIHQIDWWIDCEDKKIADTVQRIMEEMWTRMVRALSQSHWAGYSPIALEYDNNMVESTIDITKFKDLRPEECVVNWKYVEGYAPSGKVRPKIPVYDGIKQFGAPYPIPPENTLWYPLLMENGDYYGTKILKAAFAPWYFSTLVHLFANRYYERFGEPLPVGRAPFDDEVDTGDGYKNGKEVMEGILMNLRNRSVVVLPSQTQPLAHASTKAVYDYDIEYLESQMRGADFEKYLSRLDEEMSLGIFTPILLFKSGDVGSHNLGVQHTQTFLWMLNALAGDMKEYIDRYVCERLKALNFSPKAPRCQWRFRPLGKENAETVRAVLTALVTNGEVGVDLEQLGMIIGLDLKQIQQVGTNPDGTPDPTKPDQRVRDKPGEKRKGVGEPRATGRQISNRVATQVEKAWREGKFGTGFKPDMGHKRRMIEAFRMEGFDDAEVVADKVLGNMDTWLDNAVGLGPSEWSGPKDFVAMFERALDYELELV
jgi:hypothetical protein